MFNRAKQIMYAKFNYTNTHKYTQIHTNTYKYTYQEIAKITRLIDDVPTRAEVLQYERRFVELYELVQSKLIETRKYYELYNALNESYSYMENEDNLLNSIIEGFPLALKVPIYILKICIYVLRWFESNEMFDLLLK